MADVLCGLSPARIFARPTAETAWLGPAQRSALSHLTSERPCKILSGPPVSGRTLLLERLGRELGTRAKVISLSAAHLSEGSVLTSVLDAIGLDHGTHGLDARLGVLDAFLAERSGAGERVVITIDDAERLSSGAVRELERLSARCERPERQLELALNAMPKVGGSILERRMGASAIHALRWLDREEVEAYVAWRLERFGLPGLFTRTATHLIARCTQGRFPAIDILCQMALLLMRRRTVERVDVTLVNEATDTLARRRQLTALERRLPLPGSEARPPRALLEPHGDQAAVAAQPPARHARPQLRLVK